MSFPGNAIGSLLDLVRERMPVVHHITNRVTTSECANIVKSFGASPVMAEAPEEASAMTAIADALVLNIGTLTRPQVASMKLSGITAANKGIPIVLDVCGAGATPYRDAVCEELLNELQISIVKGNASEIAAVAGGDATTRGVDAGAVKEDLDALVVRLATAQSACVIMTGPVDRVTDGSTVWHVGNGHPMMATVVGTGCMATSVIGMFAAVSETSVQAGVSALVCYGIAAETAAESATGPGSFRTALFDAVHTLDSHTISRFARVMP